MADRFRARRLLAEPNSNALALHEAPKSGQLHCELVAFVKLFTDFFTLDASWTTIAIVVAEGLDCSDAMEFFSALTDEVMALVWLGKSLLAELTTAVAALSTFWACAFQALAPLLTVKLVSPLTALWRLLRSVQYAGLLLPQPASATIPIATAPAAQTRSPAPPLRTRDPASLALALIVIHLSS